MRDSALAMLGVSTGAIRLCVCNWLQLAHMRLCVSRPALMVDIVSFIASKL